MRKRWDKTERNTQGETSARTTYPTRHTALLCPSTTARDGGKIGRIPARRAVWAGNLQPTPTGLSLPRADIKPHNGWKRILHLNLRTQRFVESASNPPDERFGTLLYPSAIAIPRKNLPTGQGADCSNCPIWVHTKRSSLAFLGLKEL